MYFEVEMVWKMSVEFPVQPHISSPEKND